MGVKNLWDILECCKKTVPLHHLQNKRVCVDLSCWMVQLHNVNKTHCALKSKLYLQCLFHRLRALTALNCSLILVTDGSIPSIKLSAYRRRLNDGIEVNQEERKGDKVSLRRNKGSKFSCMVKEAKILGKALGIPCLDGVEEAEAQCALLTSESLCDGCFTSDSDAFLFGARTIYRDICLGEGGYVVCYEMADIERKLGFGRNSLISLAVILGGDYSKGVHGIGRESAIEILNSVGDDSVLQQISSEGLSFLKKGKGSKKNGNILSLNHKGGANRNEINLQGNNEFLQVINAYLTPKCHPADSDVVRRALAVYPFSQTELHQICSQFFEWSPKKTDEYILPKIAERELRRYANLRFTSSEAGVKLTMYEMPVRCPISSIIKPRKLQGKDCFEVSWEEKHGLKTSVVPADLVERACPEKIQEFQEGKAQAKKRNPCKERPKKSENAPSVVELDSKLQKLLLDIDDGYKTIEAANRLSEADLSLQELLLKDELYSEAELSYAFDCNLEPSSSSQTAEVIDLCTPLPIKNRNVSKHRVECVDVIELLLDIDDDYKTIEAANRLSEADLSLQKLPLKDELCSEAELRYAFDCNLEPSSSSQTAEVIDLCTPLPIKNRNVSKHRAECDVIDLSDSENESSPDCERNGRELRPLVVSIEDDRLFKRFRIERSV